MPQSVADSNSANWGENTLNAALAAGLEGGKNVVAGENPFKSAEAVGKDIFNKFQGALLKEQGKKQQQLYFQS